MLLNTDKIFSIFMYAQAGDNQVCTLEVPNKVLDMDEQEIKLGYKIMLSEARLKNFGDNNTKVCQKIQNILKIRGVKGSILLDLFPKRRGQGPRPPPGYGPGELNHAMTPSLVKYKRIRITCSNEWLDCSSTPSFTGKYYHM